MWFGGLRGLPDPDRDDEPDDRDQAAQVKASAAVGHLILRLRASLAESRARLPRRGENAGAPQLLVARGHDAKRPHRLFVTPQARAL